MQIKDQDTWELYKKNNSEGYGLGIISFAERWADEMERQLEFYPIQDESDIDTISRAFGEIARDCERVADTEDITGFMYGAAVTTLSHIWKYGEALRQWHNRKTQIGSEGDEANQNGGVLNPALLTISV